MHSCLAPVTKGTQSRGPTPGEQNLRKGLAPSRLPFLGRSLRSQVGPSKSEFLCQHLLPPAPADVTIHPQNPVWVPPLQELPADSLGKCLIKVCDCGRLVPSAS